MKMRKFSNTKSSSGIWTKYYSFPVLNCQRYIYNTQTYKTQFFRGMFIQTRDPVRAETFIYDGISTQNIVFNDKN